MTPGPNPVLFVGDLYPSRIYKVSLEGKLLGVYGQPGRNLGEFGWIHAIACPSENEIWVGELDREGRTVWEYRPADGLTPWKARRR